MDFENMNIWCWLIPALVGIISGILGYLIGKGSSTSIDNSADLKIWKDKNAKLQADLDACNNKLKVGAAATGAAAVASMAPSKPKAKAAAPSASFDADAAKAAFGKKIKLDDLKVVEGIGPKIESMFKAGGIGTWRALSEASVADCQKILDGGGERYRVHNPGSWPLQAKMAYEGKWAELVKWQDEHDHGRL
jgi:predicted flap endonuclease-1-like 5' DNA nuclease